MPVIKTATGRAPDPGRPGARDSDPGRPGAPPARPAGGGPECAGHTGNLANALRGRSVLAVQEARLALCLRSGNCQLEQSCLFELGTLVM